MNKKLVIAVSLTAVAALFFVGSYFYKASEIKRVESLAQSNKVYFEREHSPSLGSTMARVTLVEFLDPECEACRAFYPFIKEILKDFGGGVRLVIRYAPFHHNSKFAVQLLEAARKQGLYWEAMDLFFEHQPEWGDHHNPQPEKLWGYLEKAGVDVDKAREDMKDPAIMEMIELDIKDGARLGARRTPTFFINGKPLENFGFEGLRAQIQREMDR